MDYYVTDTETEALAQDAADYNEAKTAQNGLPLAYWETTIRWDVPRQRLDGKWVRSVCPTSTATGRTIGTDPQDGTWFVIESGE